MQSKDDDCVRNYCAWIFLSTQPSILAIFYDTWPITLQQSGLYSASVVTLTNPWHIISINSTDSLTQIVIKPSVKLRQ